MQPKIVPKTRKGKKLSYVIGMFVFAILATTVFFAIEAAASGAELSELESREYALTRRNSELAELILAKSSLTRAESMAESLGFIKPDTVYYVPSQNTFAKLP